MQFNNLDIELYDRQIRTYGIDAVNKITSSSVCIIGLDNGLGTEIVKNLALSGIQNIYLLDDGIINLNDTINGIYYKKENIGEKRNKILLENIKNLNPFVNVNILNDITNIKLCDVTISVNKNITEMIEINNQTRNFNKKFIGLLSKEISGCIFVDAGSKHIISQLNSEIYESIQISNIEFSETKMIITCANGHEFQSNDLVKFTNLQGENIDIIENKNFEIYVLNKFKFEIPFIKENNIKFINGTVNYVNKNIEINHSPLSEQIININDDIIKYYLSLDNFDNFLQPVISIMGSIVASETIKLITSKYLPISQWFSWNDDNISFDQILKINNELKASKWLIVGSGAIGCELLKNLAYLNIENIIITDPDIIEKSNLNRQFLFRNEHIGELKSKIASQVIKQMKDNLNISSLSEKVGNDNKLFTDLLLGSKELTGVFNALDNIEARKFMDEQCFNYELPLFESGTLGTKGNTQPIIPFITETYSASNDPPIVKSYAVCTIKHFPNEIHHTIHWALDQFEFFNRAPLNIQKMLNGDEINDNTADGQQALNDIYDFTIKNNIINYDSCILWAMDMFYENYHNQILQLLHNFPADSLTNEGALFWSSGKRCPQPIIFDINNELHIDYIICTSRLLSTCVGIDNNFNKNYIINIINTYEPKKFEPKTNNEKQNILNKINISIDKYNFKPNNQILDKDDDNNYHIKWINTASNLRAINYGIPIVDFQYTKGIAGKIIPAIATTTSTIAGLITLEMLKYMIYKNTNINKYRSTFINLADLTFVSAEPIEAKQIEIAGQKFNSWYKFIHKGDCLLFDFKEKYEKLFNTKISMITIDSNIIFADFMDNENKLLVEIIKSTEENIDLNNQNIIFTLASEDENVELPNIVFMLN